MSARDETFAVYCAGEQINGVDGITYIYMTTPLGKVRLTEDEADELGEKLAHAAAYNRALDDDTAPGKDSQPAESTRPPDLTPIPLRWDRLVMHPAGQDDQTIVCCMTDDGHPAALFLDDEHREALGLQLVDPNGDDSPAEPAPVSAGELLALIADFVDPDPCWYDHHGYCQAHGWTTTDPACPHARARTLLASTETATEGSQP